MARRDTDHQGDVLTKKRARTKRPPMYKVLLLNDDYTPMDFVVMVLEVVFRKTRPDAVHVMLMVHTQGQGLAGTYTREVAETKVQQVESLARQEGHPLKCILEPE